MIFDTHAHYDDEQFNEDRVELLNSMEEQGVGTIINVSATYNSCRKVIALAKEYPFVYAAVGIHPDEVGSLNEETFAQMKELFKEEKVVAVGEIHSREAAADTMEIMKEHAKGLSGVIHCYSYSKEMAQEYIKMGFYIGVGGVVTFKNAKKLKEVVENIPLTSIVLETDCPYMAPEPNRGKRNNSAYIRYVAEKIAELKGITYEEVVEQTEKNARDMYRL